MGDSKPIDINTENALQCGSEPRDSLSAYASAESSPSQAGAAASGRDSVDLRLLDEPYLASEVAGEINTYWGLPPASSLLIDEEDKRDALEHSKMSQSKSFYDSSDLSKCTDTDKEYQSLPLQETKPIVTAAEKSGELKRELSQSDLFKLKEVESEDDLVSVELRESVPTSNTRELPEMSTVPKTKSSTMAFIESIFKGSSAKVRDSNYPSLSKVETHANKSETKATDDEPLVSDTKVAASALNVALSSAAASASSPNPECSPYKFLLNEYPSKVAAAGDQKVVTSLNLECVAAAAAADEQGGKRKEKSGVVVEKIIENLASLTRKDSEEHDPILSGAAASTSSTKKSDSSLKDKTEKKSSKAKAKSPSKSVSSITSALKSQTTKMDSVPASSREFTMNLNFNLASAAAATAGGPVVVVDNSSNSKSPVAKEHNKFTSNASTSSIHNDLKMILEESKEDKKQAPGKENKKLNESIDKKRLSKKQKKEKQNTSKSNVSNTSFNTSSAADTTGHSMSVETGNLSPTSKANSLNLIKMMMLMVDSNNAKKHGKVSLNKQLDVESRGEESSLIDLAKQNGRYKYSREFLLEIKEQRSKFIDQIQPEIFKAYCYCMNGKYWDPEKYFDIVQFPGDYDRIRNNNNNNNNNNNRNQLYNKSSTGSKYTKSGKFTPNATFSNNHSRAHNATPNAAPAHAQDDSPQPLQVPKNSPKFSESRKDATTMQCILESLGLNTDHIAADKAPLDADKILLGLIQRDNSSSRKDATTSDKPSNLMDILAKASAASPSLLDNLLSKPEKQQAVPVPKHRPLVLTAQELEMSQLSQERHKLPNEISMTRLEELQQSVEANDSFAYKQLVRNLSTHPLNSATALGSRDGNYPSLLGSRLEASLNRLQSKQRLDGEWQVSSDGTNVIKQLLNLRLDEREVKRGGNDNESNPHEKPFESYSAEEREGHYPSLDENRKQIEHIVASALSHVLSKSPTSAKHQASASPTPKSPIEDLIEKIQTKHKETSKQEHFNSLLSKMGNSQPLKETTTTTTTTATSTSTSSNDSDILKWFNDVNKSSSFNAKTVHSLSEIESMQLHRPVSALNKLF